MKHETFEDRLLAKLTELDATRPVASPVHRPVPLLRRPAVLVTAAAVTVLVVAGAIGLANRPVTSPPGNFAAQSNGNVAVKPASFTVVKNADGTVTFTVHDLLDLSGATKALNDAGIVGRVVTNTQDCTTGPNVVPVDPNDLYPADTFHRLSKGGGIVEGDSVTLSSSFYPAGGGLLLTVGGGYMRFHNNELRLFVGYLAYIDANKIPQCVNFVDPGTGDFPQWPPTPRVR
ncbi:MAG TPA: hypothetical protein VFC19_21805 [Candidatus Limnocylindrales bacterium]|nr:hypothetical protein [Candidatus Limnocylindrales bacterium]